MSHPFNELSDIVNRDSEYAWSILCNLACPIADELNCSHEQSNRAAARVMRHWFAVDITKHENWKAFERHWSQPIKEVQP